MKKLATLALSAVCAFSLFACGGKSGSSKGSDISNQEAQTMFTRIREKSAVLSTDDFTKLTYTAKIQTDDEILTTTHKFSKEDYYIYDLVKQENVKLYDSYDGTSEYIGTIHTGIVTNYFYVSEDGKAIDAATNYEDATYKNEETGLFERDVFTSNGYKYFAETLEESQAAFESNILTEASEMMTDLLSYSTQMLQTFESYIIMPTSVPGLEIKSNGEGHLYMECDMSDYGMYYECEFSNYMLTYMKTIVDYEKTGVPEAGIKKMTSEIHFQIGVCEISYPNLNNYTFNG